MKLKLDKISEIIGCNASDKREISHLLTDSRSLTEAASTLFFALHTSYNDGHNYVKDLYLSGVRAFVVEHASADELSWPDATFLVVPSVIEALQRIGAYARRMFRGRVVAITGSVGKTVMKELLYYRLTDRHSEVYHSPRSWNSQIGVPLSLWRLPESAGERAVALVECGIDSPGQMKVIRDIVRPDYGVLTPITSEHDSGFTSREQKIAEKRILFQGCRATFEAHDFAGFPEVATQLCRMLGAEASDTELPAGFSTRIDTYAGPNDCIIVSDAFTCDTDALEEALDYCRRRITSSRTLTVILGDLRHEGDADTAYRTAARLLDTYGAKRLILIGKEASAHASAFNHVMLATTCPSVEDFVETVAEHDFNSEMILVKVAPEFHPEAIRARLEPPRHDTTLEVDLDAIVHNFKHYRGMLRPSTGIVCMVKASAYGTGAVEVSKTLQSQGAAYLAVAVIDEGVALRRNGITMPIMVLNPITSDYRSLFEYRLEPAAFSPDELRRLIDEAAAAGVKDYPVHIKLDTGMHRVGFLEHELASAAEMLRSTSAMKAASAFSHLATADCTGMDAYTLGQIEAFERMTAAFKAALGYPFLRHILNTAGIQRFPQFQMDLVRLGVGLYGVNPVGTPAEQDLRQVATLASTIISLKHWPAGTPIGYGCRGRVERDSIVATVPIGYADGVDRHLGRGAARFVVNGVECPTVGNICMDLCMIDVTDAGARIGDRVEVFGPAMPVETVAETLDTIPYEVLTSVSPRVKRIYFRE